MNNNIIPSGPNSACPIATLSNDVLGYLFDYCVSFKLLGSEEEGYEIPQDNYGPLARTCKKFNFILSQNYNKSFQHRVIEWATNRLPTIMKTTSDDGMVQYTLSDCIKGCEENSVLTTLIINKYPNFARHHIRNLTNGARITHANNVLDLRNMQQFASWAIGHERIEKASRKAICTEMLDETLSRQPWEIRTMSFLTDTPIIELQVIKKLKTEDPELFKEFMKRLTETHLNKGMEPKNTEIASKTLSYLLTHGVWSHSDEYGKAIIDGFTLMSPKLYYFMRKQQPNYVKLIVELCYSGGSEVQEVVFRDDKRKAFVCEIAHELGIEMKETREVMKETSEVKKKTREANLVFYYMYFMYLYILSLIRVQN